MHNRTGKTPLIALSSVRTKVFIERAKSCYESGSVTRTDPFRKGSLQNYSVDKSVNDTMRQMLRKYLGVESTLYCTKPYSRYEAQCMARNKKKLEAKNVPGADLDRFDTREECMQRERCEDTRP